MQTFVPSKGFMRSASQLDVQRLGKQRLETLQILDSIENGTGYKNHPVNDMWKGYEDALVVYGLATVHEWTVVRKNRDSTTAGLYEWMNKLGMRDLELTYGKNGQATGVEPGQAIERPPWVGNIWIHRSHRSNLIRKRADFYTPIFGEDTPEDMPYLWPVNDHRAPGGYRVFLSRADIPRLVDRQMVGDVDFRILPPDLILDEKTREVTPASGEWPMA